jgi:hypothetical protein
MNGRYLLAVALSPLLIPVAVYILLSVSGAQGGGVGDVFVLGCILAFSYLGVYAIGLPSVFFLRKRGKLNILYLALTGIFGGVIIFLLAMEFLGWLLGSSAPVNLVALIWGGAMGLSVSIVFGVIAGVPLLADSDKDA